MRQATYEIDEQTSIEVGILAALSNGQPATIQVEYIEKTIPGATPQQKLDALAAKVNARYTLEADRAVFRAAPEATVPRMVDIICGNPAGYIVETLSFASLRIDGTFKVDSLPDEILTNEQIGAIASALLQNKVAGEIGRLTWHAASPVSVTAG